ncbi:MAG: ABC transporter substrate-binding protein [Bacteroides sp.]|nr:ABC transporter substrate-binding protein [Bacteroides sp.]MCM1379976.1 ABC transporter substrate-binding protein [Bacteroides sp.]MCM1446269.1 ABC transporter substrate-binding protein [Prevotella sp.]
MNKYCLLIPLLALCGCKNTPHCADAADFTQTVYEPEYATGFKIYSLPNDFGRQAVEIYRPDTMRIVVPEGGFKSVMCMSSTYVGALSQLGADSMIVAVSNRDYIVNPYVSHHAAEAGYEGAMDYEAILAAKPEVAMIYGIGGHSPIEAKLKELNIPYVYINDFEEQNPLGRAEWMVAIGALVGKDAAANFDAVKAAYCPTSGETMVMINAPYSGNWFIPGRDNYMSKLITDAGGKLSASQQAGAESTVIDLEEAIPALNNSQVWLNPGQAGSLADAQRLIPKARINAEVWNQTSDFYESGASRPDLVLDELKMIFSGTESDSLRYFVRLK